MKYNVAQLLQEPIGSLRSYELNEKFSGPQKCAELVSGPVQLLRVHHGILVRAIMEVQSYLICGRCLGEFFTTSQLMIEEEFFPTVDLQTGRRTPLPEEAEETALINSNHILDLTSTIDECIITEIPMKPLCQPDCRGLCQMCGTNQNVEACECANQIIDPRWKALAGLAPEE
jgi:uncharacterized protein